MKILEHQDERSCAREGEQEVAHALEDQGLEGFARDARHTLGVRAGQPHVHETCDEGEHIAHLGWKPRRDRGFELPAGGLLVVLHRDLRQALQKILEGMKRQILADRERARLDSRSALRLFEREHLGYEPRLPEPRIPQDRRDAAPPIGERTERLPECAELRLPADQPRVHPLALPQAAVRLLVSRQHLVGADRLLDVLQVERLRRPVLEIVPRRVVGRGSDVDRARWRLALQTRGQVHGVAERIVDTALNPDRDLTGVDPGVDVELQLLLLGEPQHAGAHLDSGIHRGVWRVLDHLRRPEHGHQAVADALDRVAAEANDLLLHHVEAPVRQPHEVGGVHFAAEASEARDVREEDGRPSPLKARRPRLAGAGRSVLVWSRHKRGRQYSPKLM